MKIDLHNHTPLCNHAEGDIETFVKTAIEVGIDIFGFADHAPMDFDEKYRMNFEQMKEYEAEVREVAKKYQDKITIRLGYEVDYLENHIDRRVIEADVDYLIGSVHFIDEWGFDNPEFIGNYQGVDLKQIWQKYFDAITQMAKSELFNIVGHFDLIKVFNFKPNCDICQLAEEALDAIAKADMTMEINSAGWRKPVNEAYPSLELLRMAYDRGITITFSSDAHRIEEIGYRQKSIYELANSAGYKEVADFCNKERRLHKF